MSHAGKTYTEHELGEKIQNVEQELKKIFKNEYIPLFLIQKSKRLFKKWKLLTNWQEDKTPPYDETLKNK